MSEEQAASLWSAVNELILNTFSLGLAQGSGSDCFRGGQLYTLGELKELQIEKAGLVSSLIGEATA